VKDETDTGSDEEEEPRGRTLAETHPELEPRVREGPDGVHGGENVFDKM
jgi:hypothetical protein